MKRSATRSTPGIRALRGAGAVALLAALGAGIPQAAAAAPGLRADTTATPPREEDFYRLVTLPVPEDVVLEVGGLESLPDGRLAVSTRRGEVWLVENPSMAGGSRPHFSRFAHGLHEPLGLAYRDGVFYAAQRGELTRLRDTDGDGRADRYETVASWPLAGNYHEYSYGPVFGADGKMYVTLNLAWVGRGASLARWRGWTLEITPDGKMTPFATGMRSPAGFGFNLNGDLFYAENQGDWVGSGFISHVEKGDFLGSPEGLRWSGEPGSPVRLRVEDVPDTGEPRHEVARRVPGLKNPAVWFPHGVLGISTSAILVDSTRGAFGPFHGQLFVADQGHSKINRVYLEKVGGVYQGVVFPFREGFMSGILRQAWGRDGSMYVGMTSRGWDATGKAPYGLQRLVWTGKVPFEAEKVEARPDGFEITFTAPVDPATAGDPASYRVSSFIYKYHHNYGSPVINRDSNAVRGVVVSGDGRRARIVVDGLREGYVHELRMAGVRSAGGLPLLHDVGYYTLNRIPAGERLQLQPARRAAAPAPAAARAAARPRAGGAVPRAAGVAKHQTTIPASWNGTVDATYTVRAVPGLKWDLPRIDARPGARVRLVLVNASDMLHNLLVVRPGTAGAVADAALKLGIDGMARAWVPASGDVLFHTSLVEPEASETIYFQVPTAPGDYTYVCTFPGHASSMQGTLRVAR